MKLSPKAVASVESPIGPITLIAQGEKIVRVELGKKARAEGSSKVLTEAKKQLDAYFSGKLERFSVPIDAVGTEFQKSVWKEIAKIGFGRQISYGEIAAKIGKPAASRAVGAAVGSNPTPLLVGCHRVLGSTGKITGFTGAKGIKTKAWLLNHEQIEFRP
ncbi:MAG: methylated-DNA--[protein]-cysteine S-methyltransferase [Actinobacteria bacterium]|jgi:methylated-DNA-[protein]-cysteine S-methyltransferase|uniref:methylated-DNA--[protein]-cysteine S-methyltransferase n=1 Tax=freshwater metagenome TaxID=449393 RepID=A0A6J6M364_9ZZZZ|nr:methylated-DNA--[protein]-cysteine S-methyltransferase [Actinomycetota bacterium]